MILKFLFSASLLDDFIPNKKYETEGIDLCAIGPINGSTQPTCTPLGLSSLPA